MLRRIDHLQRDIARLFSIHHHLFSFRIIQQTAVQLDNSCQIDPRYACYRPFARMPVNVDSISLAAGNCPLPILRTVIVKFIQE